MYETKMDLRRLRYFLVIAEELSFSRASKRLRVAQPSLSSQIRRMESELGVQLFDRVGRGIRLTEAGEVLVGEARRIFIQVDQTTRIVERVSSGAVGRLSVGFVPSSSNEVLPPILSRFREDYPNVELFLNEMRPDQVLTRLHGKQLDVGFLYLPFEDETLDFESVAREPLVAALPEEHPLANEDEIELSKLSDEPFVLPMRYQMPGLYGCVTEACREAGFVPRAIQKDIWLMQTIVALVAGGVGVALVPASLRSVRRRGVAYLDLAHPAPTVETGVVWRRDDGASVLASFLGVVRESSPTS